MARQTPARPVNRAVATQRAHLARELVETLLLVGLIFVIVHFTIQSFAVNDTSMGAALQPGQTVLVNTKAYLFGGPGRGDVVVITTDPSNPNATIARRIVGLPGDTVAVSATKIIVNGVTLNEPFIQVPAGSGENSTLNPAVKLGPNQYFVLADSRIGTDNTDSRTLGAVPMSDIIGKAVMVFWPVSQFHWIDTHSDDYSNIKNP
ncbi:MAG TPA: signal peptidase I [Ktedonobacterales bacterium]|jgi:signal peptidase I|nr:signal peptidase I [Ktedonobacterales bacterium]